MTIKPYTAYKRTNLAWLPQVPEHWNVVKAGLQFSDNKNKNSELEENNILSLSYGRIISKLGNENAGLTPASYEGYQIVEPGYIILRLTDLQNDKRSLRVGLAEQKGIITSAYVGLKPNQNTVSKYYYYLLHYLDLIKYFYSLGGGVRQSSDFNEIRKQMILFPPPAEQTAIAEFLDRKTAQIDTAIAKKQQLIELLKEQKQNRIDNLLAGDENIKLKYIVNKISKGTTPSTEGESFTDFGIRYIKAENILSDCISNEPQYFISENTHNILSRSQLKENDILFVIAGATLGKCAILQKEQVPANTNQAVAFIRLKSNENHKFVLYCLQTTKIRNLIWLDAVQSAQPNLSMSNLSNFPIYYPSKEKQEEIVAHIERESQQTDTTISRIEREIELLKEYRTTLIANAVTGRIKVI